MTSATPMTLMPRKPNTAPRLLVSVRDASEAIEALAGGADVIDVKEPSAGPLGRATSETLAAVLDAVAGRAPVTAALGELRDVGSLALPAGLFAAKCGLAGSLGTDWRESLLRLRGVLPPETRLVPAAYADHAAAAAPPPEDVLAAAMRLGTDWLVVDTWEKTGGDSLSALGTERVSELLSRASSQGVSVVLAGRLSADRFTEAINFSPSLIGVRGAACEGGRGGRVTADLVRALVDRLAAAGRCQ